MYNEELVDLIAEAVHRHLRDDVPITVIKKEYNSLTEVEKACYLTIAHDIMGIFDDWYDAEIDEDDLEEDEDMETDLYGDKWEW